MNLVNIPISMDALQALWALRKDDNEAASQTILRLAGCQTSSETASSAALPPVAAPNATGKFQYEILGDRRSTGSAIDAYLDILATLAALEPTLPEKLSVVARGNSRNHIAPTPGGVYPERPDLAESARQFAPGWYAGTNICNRDKLRILRLACGVLGLDFGADIVFGAPAPALNLDSLF